MLGDALPEVVLDHVDVGEAGTSVDREDGGGGLGRAVDPVGEVDVGGVDVAGGGDDGHGGLRGGGEGEGEGRRRGVSSLGSDECRLKDASVWLVRRPSGFSATLGSAQNDRFSGLSNAQRTVVGGAEYRGLPLGLT